MPKDIHQQPCGPVGDRDNDNCYGEVEACGDRFDNCPNGIIPSPTPHGPEENDDVESPSLK